MSLLHTKNTAPQPPEKTNIPMLIMRTKLTSGAD
ncbi:Uncharacterised protein [Budvicia aquatica]|uniref:Uncharacterized protein n=1 Tax=Budvicia aquatica TaxID=82979 RepID=A0A484ZF98_9GAMM|nr:Uncharacterised protein [Budvicia aquatica]